MMARKRDLIGRRIVEVDFRRYWNPNRREWMSAIGELISRIPKGA